MAPRPLIAEYGDYPAMFERLLHGQAPALEFAVYRVRDSEFPASSMECDSWLITGSRDSVLDASPWMVRLEDFVRRVARDGGRLVGICFGHQLVATAFGGRVERAASGWAIGRQAYDVVEPSGGHQSIRLNAFHQDQVVELPEGGRLYASSASCPNAIVEIGETLLTIQAHPEFGNDFLEALIRCRLSGTLDRERLNNSVASLDDEPDTERVAKLMVEKLGLRLSEA